MKRPPDRKLLLAVAILVVAAGTMLARSAGHARADTQIMNHHVVLGVR